MAARWFYASILALLLSACGGGSGGADTSSGADGPPASEGSPNPAPAPAPPPSPEESQPPSSGGNSSDDGSSGGNDGDGEGSGSDTPAPEPTPVPQPEPAPDEPQPPASGGDNGEESDASDEFAATVTMAPGHGAFLEGTIRLEVHGNGMENVELLPAQGYEPILGTFTISSDKTFAYLDIDTEELPEGTFDARISAFNAPAGSSSASEIIAMQPRQWTTPDGNGTPAPGPLTDIRFENPHEIASDANGNLYVADGENNRDRIRQIAPDGSVTTLVPEDDHTITALAVTSGGEVFYSSAGDSTSGSGFIWRIENGVPVQITSEEMAISEFVIDPSNGNLYVGVWTQSGPEVKEVRQDGSVTTLFSIDESHGAPAVMTLRGDVLWLAWRDGPYRTREFRWSRANGLEEVPIDVDYVTGMEATDSGIYIAGYSGSSANISVSASCTVNLLDPDTLELTHVAGVEGEPCHYEEDTPPPDRLDLRFTSLTQASDGNLYLTENFRDVIRKITPDGEVSTYAGVHNQPGY